ncbi:MAG: hypothetical protein MJZ86_03525 [Bacteroidales bacterium]|nr:hypothetical protein [Bacteroidales bacterium]
MSIELLATQGRDRVYGGLASVDSSKLRQMRDNSLRNCFARFEEMNYRMEHVARIYGKEFVNDAAARSVNATWYTLENTEGNIIWIALGGDNEADYARLRPLALRKVRMLICVGTDTDKLHEAFKDVVSDIVDVDNLRAAVTRACYSPLENAKVIFSPATKQGLDDETAGRLFRHEVNEL